MPTLLLVVASTLFALGGLFMKMSGGMSRLWPSIMFMVLFGAGAAVQSIGMRRSDLGAAYIFVLGVEVLVTVLLSAGYLHERYSLSRIAAIVLVLVGIIWLNAT
jgi:multidrug transporter EmrE-like cation transporter